MKNFVMHILHIFYWKDEKNNYIFMKNFNRLLHSIFKCSWKNIFTIDTIYKEVSEQISGYKSITMQREGLHV